MVTTSAKLVVFTAITGGFKNEVRPPILNGDMRDSDVAFVCYSDCVFSAPSPWKLFPPTWEHDDPRRTARYHKLLPHRLFPDAEYWLWMDGNQQLAVSPWALVDRYMVGPDLSTYKHPERKNVHQELGACIRMKKDDPRVMRTQVQRYEREGYATRKGRLFETTVVLRRNTPKMRDMNEMWWEELRDGSVRDQLSLPYVTWKLDQEWIRMQGQRDKPVHFNYFPHR